MDLPKQVPTPGRMVHFIGTDGITYPAVVVAAHPVSGIADLFVIGKNGTRHHNSIPYGAEGDLGEWVWPPQVAT